MFGISEKYKGIFVKQIIKQKKWKTTLFSMFIFPFFLEKLRIAFIFWFEGGEEQTVRDTADF
jgi:hypothetical protein